MSTTTTTSIKEEEPEFITIMSQSMNESASSLDMKAFKSEPLPCSTPHVVEGFQRKVLPAWYQPSEDFGIKASTVAGQRGVSGGRLHPTQSDVVPKSYTSSVNMNFDGSGEGFARPMIYSDRVSMPTQSGPSQFNSIISGDEITLPIRGSDNKSKPNMSAEELTRHMKHYFSESITDESTTSLEASSEPSSHLRSDDSEDPEAGVKTHTTLGNIHVSGDCYDWNIAESQRTLLMKCYGQSESEMSTTAAEAFDFSQRLHLGGLRPFATPRVETDGQASPITAHGTPTRTLIDSINFSKKPSPDILSLVESITLPKTRFAKLKARLQAKSALRNK